MRHLNSGVHPCQRIETMNRPILYTITALFIIVCLFVVRPIIKPKVVLCLGDSITMGVGGTNGGYRGYLQDMLGSRYVLVTEAHKGWTTEQIRKIVPLLLMEVKPDIVLLMIGTNDIHLGKFEEGAINIPKIIYNILLKDSNTKIIAGKLLPSKKYDFDVAFFNLVLLFIDKEFGSAVDTVLFGLTEEHLSDGIHPNDEGYKIMAKAWYDEINARDVK